MKTLTPSPMTAATRMLPRTVRADPDLARRCQRAERITFVAVALAMLVFAGSGVQPGSAYPETPPVEAPAYGWP
jgi:hypothetical protein